MPSFVASGEGCNIDRNKVLAAKFGIEVYTYKTLKTKSPSISEFANLLIYFDDFCNDNKNSTCDMLMLTGYHGKYGNYGIFNNLNAEQLKLFVQTAEKYQVKFKQILADCCCAAFGLKKLESLLADGGEAIGDRTTSTAYRMQEKLVEKMLEADAEQSNDEKKLIDAVIEEGMNTFNAPVYITKNKEKISAVGTTVDEVKHSLINEYKQIGLIDNKLSDKDAEIVLRKAGFAYEFNMLTKNLNDSCQLFAIKEEPVRAHLLASRQQHQAMHQDQQKYTVTHNYSYSRRYHAFHAESKGLNSRFYQFQGDFLKLKILDLFKSKIEKTSSKNQLDLVMKDIIESNEFKTLKRGQGIFTRIFNLKTSSLEEFEKMVIQQRENLKNRSYCLAP